MKCDDEVIEGEARQSEATNIKRPLYEPNLNEHDLVFATLHPYAKHKAFAKNQILSKVSDKIRRKMKSFLLVKEPNKKVGRCHYHLVGYLAHGTDLQLKGFKIWKQKVSSSNKDKPFYTSVSDLYTEYISDMSNMDNHIEWELFKAENQDNYGAEMGKWYGNKRRSIADQYTSIVDYMFKLNPKREYEDWIRVEPKDK